MGLEYVLVSFWGPAYYLAYFQVLKPVSFREFQFIWIGNPSEISEDAPSSPFRTGLIFLSAGIPPNEIQGSKVGSLLIKHVGVNPKIGVFQPKNRFFFTPKSSILIGCSIVNHPFWGTPIFGNIHVEVTFTSKIVVSAFCLPFCRSQKLPISSQICVDPPKSLIFGSTPTPDS